MLKLIACGLLIVSTLISKAQFKVTVLITVKKPLANHSYYLAGNCNQWSPNDSSFSFKSVANNKYSLTFTSPKNYLEYKITAGSWETVEVDKNNIDIKNRAFTLTDDTTINFIVEGFKDKSTGVAKSTASKNVIQLTDSFYFPTLGVYKKIWVYLPTNYNAKLKYSVLYMHDGQNVFDNATSFSGEWGVDEYLDSTKKNLILVAIENGGQKRLSEYSCHKNAYVTKPVGQAYCKDLVETLMPYIAAKYSCSKLQKDNYIAGSSMGANISLYASLLYPNTFGKVGLFSPAIWINKKDILEKIKSAKSISKTKFFIYVGSDESKEMEPDAVDIKHSLDTKTKYKAYFKLYNEGKHNEQTWQQQLPSFFAFIK